MHTIEVDVAVIGAGTAGMAAYRAARAHGKRTLLIESGPYGTTCARVGCMPSKLLIAAAEAAHALAAAPGFGVHPGSVRIDGRAVMARLQSERDRFVGFALDTIDTMPAGDKIRGRARFTGPRRLQIGQHTCIEAGSIVIAVGGAPVVPAEWRKAGARVVTSDDVFDWADLPQSVAVAGSGALGLELGQALHRLGARVTIFARGDGLAQLSDPLVLRCAAQALSRELDLRFQTSIAAVDIDADGEGLLVRSRTAGGLERSERFAYLLAATGRRPNLSGLGLELAQIELDRHGVPLYDERTMQCGASAIFIAGDASDEKPVLPQATEQGQIAGDNAGRYPNLRPGLRRTPLSIVFCSPQITVVGAGYRQLSAAGEFGIGAVSFEDQGRSRIMLQNRGMLRVYGEFGSGRFIGAEMAGPCAEHIGHLLSWACQARLTVAEMLDMPFYHPVVEEGVRSALRELAASLAQGPRQHG